MYAPMVAMAVLAMRFKLALTAIVCVRMPFMDLLARCIPDSNGFVRAMNVVASDPILVAIVYFPNSAAISASSSATVIRFGFCCANSGKK